ncbi:MAG: hypothetical protein AB7H97_04395 [Pseudobdellovibrionaceae bacterium]
MDIMKRRSILFVGLEENRRDELVTFLQNNGLDADLTTVDYHGSLDSLANQNNRILITDTKIENNWRGRVLRFPEDFTFQTNGDDFERLFLRSYFRLIISRVNGEFFGKHDISPQFYSPGSSTAGFEDFRSSVESSIKFVIRGRDTEWRTADPHFDFFKVFISLGEGQAYLNVNIFNQAQVSVQEIFHLIDQDQVGGVTDQIYNAISQHFA